MAKPKRAYTEKQREEAIALLAVTTLSDASRKLGIAKSTLIQWRDGTVKCAQDCSEQYEQLRTEKKKEFIESAWKSIRLANELIERQLQRALRQEADIDELLSVTLEEIGNSEMTDKQKTAGISNLYKKIAALKIEDINKLSTTLGTLYDKQALASNEPTQNIQANIVKFEDLPI